MEMQKLKCSQQNSLQERSRPDLARTIEMPRRGYLKIPNESPRNVSLFGRTSVCHVGRHAPNDTSEHGDSVNPYACRLDTSPVRRLRCIAGVSPMLVV